MIQVETLQESPIPHQPLTPEQLYYQLENKLSEPARSSFSSIATSIAQHALDAPLSPQSDAPANATFTQKIALAREVGQNLCNAALSDLRSSFSSVLSTTPKAAPTNALWPSADPLLNLKSASQATDSEKKSTGQRWDDWLNRRVFDRTDEYNYIGAHHLDR